MNRKGFMMAELVVVSSIVLITLVGLYTSYNKIYSIYKTRIRYYDVVTLYRLGYYRDILKVNNILYDVVDSSNNGIVEVYNSSNNDSSIFSLPEIERPSGVEDRVYMINNAGGSIDREMFATMNLHTTFLDYIDFLENSIDNFAEFSYMLIMERCIPGDENDCSYAYLEVWI